MRALLFTDTHLSDATIETNKKVFAKASSLFKELNCDYLFHLGDIFTARSGQSLNVLTSFRSLLDTLPTPLYVVAGNHDKVSQESERSYLDVFSFHSNIKVCSSVQEIVPSVWVLPYFKENSVIMQEQLDRLRTASGILLAHVGIEEYFGFESQLKTRFFKNFDRVYIGHYHDRKFLKPNIQYIGSSYQVNGYGEDLEKGFLYLEDGKETFIKFEDYPQYSTIYVKASQFKGIPDFVTEHKRLVLEGTKEEILAIDRASIVNKGVELRVKFIGSTRSGTSTVYTKKSLLAEFDNHFTGDKKLGREYLKKVSC